MQIDRFDIDRFFQGVKHYSKDILKRLQMLNEQ